MSSKHEEDEEDCDLEQLFAELLKERKRAQQLEEKINKLEQKSEPQDKSK